MIKKLYKFGEYFSPLDVVKIAIKKIKRINWSALLLPISTILFLFNLILSIMLYGVFTLNKYFCKLEIRCTAKTLAIAKIVAYLVDALHDIFYRLYCVTMPFLKFCITIYKIFPNEVVYYSNQTTLWTAKEVAEVKEQYRAKFNKSIDALKKYTKVNLTDLEISDCFEEDFFTKVNEVIVELAQHNY